MGRSINFDTCKVGLTNPIQHMYPCSESEHMGHLAQNQQYIFFNFTSTVSHMLFGRSLKPLHFKIKILGNPCCLADSHTSEGLAFAHSGKAKVLIRTHEPHCSKFCPWTKYKLPVKICSGGFQIHNHEVLTS